MKSPTVLTRAVVASALALGLAACSESPAGPSARSLELRNVSASTDYLPEPSVWDRTVWVCKTGSTGTFAVAVDGGSPTSWTVANGDCEAVYSQPAGVDENHLVTVTELPAPGVTLDSIIDRRTRFGLVLSTEKLVGTNTVTVEVTMTKGAIFSFFNTAAPPPPPPPPSGTQGCTPGYWKQAHHFDSWVGYTPNTQFSAVFDNAFPGKTLLDVLKLGGGGLNALGRHTVAALLSSSNPGVDYAVATPAEVIAEFNAAFPGSDYTTLKDRFEGFNEKGCPLN